MSRLEEIKNEYAKEFDYEDWTSFINDQPNYGVENHMNEICTCYAKECSQASLEKAKKDLYNYWKFFEEGRANSPEFTIKVEDPAKVYNTAYEAYGPQAEDLFYSCVSHEESITNPENIALL